MFELVAAEASGYLLGAIPTAYLLARLHRRDVFELGSGNMGAMNTFRNLGPATGAAVLLIDIAKGALASYIGLNLPQLSGSVAPTDLTSAGLLTALIAGSAAVIGHCYSAYVGFRGGKGLATAFGVALPVYPVPALYTVVLIIALVLIIKNSDVATLITLILYPVVTLLALERLGWVREATFLVTTGVIANCLVGVIKQLQVGNSRRRAHCQR